MTKYKVKIEYIADEKAREKSYKKRKSSVLKKTGELSTLCGVEAAAIVYSPYESEPAVWPYAAGVQQVISKFRGLPEPEQTIRMENQEGFIRKRIAKSRETLEKLQRENRKMEINQLLSQCLAEKEAVQNVATADMNELAVFVEEKLKEVNNRMEFLKNQVAPSAPEAAGEMVAGGSSSSSMQEPPPPAAEAASEMVAVGSSSSSMQEPPPLAAEAAGEMVAGGSSSSSMQEPPLPAVEAAGEFVAGGPSSSSVQEDYFLDLMNDPNYEDDIIGFFP